MIGYAQGDDYVTRCLLDYLYLKKHKMVAIDLNRKQAIDVSLKAIQQSNFTGNLDRAGNKTFFHYSKSKRDYFAFFTRLSDISLFD